MFGSRGGVDDDAFAGPGLPISTAQRSGPVTYSTVRYLDPIWADLRAEATLAPGANWKGFFTMLKARGRARGDFTCVVPGADGKPLASMDARFVAKRRA